MSGMIIRCKESCHVFLWALIFYLSLLVLVGNVAQFFVDGGGSSIGYLTPMLLFSGLALPSISFFKANGRDFSKSEKRFLFYSLMLSNAALYIIYFGIRFDTEPGGKSLFVLALSFVSDVVILEVTLKYFWKIHAIGEV